MAHIYKIIVICILFQINSPALNAQQTDISIKLVRDNFATIQNQQHEGNSVGYRFFEHSPMPYGTVPLSAEEAGFYPEKVSLLEDQFKNNPNLFTYSQEIEKDEHWAKQNWTFYMNPVNDGIDILLTVQTFGEGLPEYYGVQQCFRMSGETNAEWRQTMAKTPAFSEYDLWEKEKGPKTSLTHVVRNGEWQNLRAQKEAVGARTPSGLAIDFLRTNGQLEKNVGPYEAEMLPPIDFPLITRADKNNQWVCGIYWENTSHVTNHHPADCLHPIINIGNIPPFSKRAFRGKIYWFKGSTDDLMQHYQSDFLQKNGNLRIAACQFPVNENISEKMT